jgi:hypothetical protein
MRISVWWGYLRERDHLKDLRVDGDNIKMDLKEAGLRTYGLDRSGLG